LTLDLKLSIAKATVRVSYCLLLLALSGNLWLQNQPLVIYCIVLLPLLIFVPGLLMDNVRTLIWMGFVLLLYFASAVFGVAKPEPSILDIAELVLTVILFCAAMLYARIRQVNPVA